MTVPASLLDPSLEPLWLALRSRLDRHGPEHRGTAACPELSPTGRLSVTSLLGRTPTKRLDLAVVEAALIERGIGLDLDDALRTLGYPSSQVAENRRRERARSQQAKTALREQVAEWREPWASTWADAVIGAGLLAELSDEEAIALADDVRRLLDLISETAEREAGTSSRAEIAAALYGSAHGLDVGTRRAAVVTRALRYLVGPLDGRDLWDAAGVMIDRVSAPALTWALPVTGESPLTNMINAATAGGLPVHLTLLALRRHPISVPEQSTILVVENPRLVEAAVERGVRGGLIATNGNPASAVTSLLAQLRASGATVRYHGDFDTAGLAIARRLHDRGAVPLHMDAADYNAAIERAEASGTPLDIDSKPCGETPWDPALQSAFNDRRRVIHEEFVLDQVLNAFAKFA